MRVLSVSIIVLLAVASCARSPEAPVGSAANPPGEGCDDRFPWCDTSLPPEERTALLLDALTLDEKIALMAGDDPDSAANGDPAVGVADGVPRLGINTVFYSDGPVGVREPGQTTAHPAPIMLASTFNRDLAFEVGKAIANEVKHKGNDVVHAPTTDVVRILTHGRVFETYGEDPYLHTELGLPWTAGAESEDIIVNIKHLVANTQEGLIGAPPITSVIGGRNTVNAVIDERTLREIYLPPFEAVIKQLNIGSIMCAYNYLNGDPTCASEHLLQTILRDEWGFDGYVLTDYYFAQKDTVNSANRGTDLEMPFGIWYSAPNLSAALNSGQVSEETIDERVGNILRSHFRYGLLDRPNYPVDEVAIDQAAHAEIAQRQAEQGTVLLINDGILPLDATNLTSIAIIGESADRYVNGGGSSAVNPYNLITPRQAITERVGAGVAVNFHPGDNAATAATLAAGVDVAFVFVTDNATEGTDRQCLNLSCPGEMSQNQDDLITAVATANANTVVILQTGSAVLTPWKDNIAALLQAWYPGQNGGPPIAGILFGDLNPQGKLPLSFPESADDTPYANNPAQYPGLPIPGPAGSAYEATYSEGVFIGYRWYDDQQIAPAFPYGFGLSYTTFEYSDLQIAGTGTDLTVTATITNTGGVAGTEIAQLYVAIPSQSGVDQPPRQLKGFDRIELDPGQSGAVTFQLDDRSFSFWNEATNQFEVVPGCHSLEVGPHSRDLPLSADVAMAGGDCL